MTDRHPLFDDRRFADLAEQARAELRRRLTDAGTLRPISTEEDAVLVSAALLVDHLHDRLGALSERLRAPLLELLGLRPSGPRAAVTHVRLTFDAPLTGELHVPAGTEIHLAASADPFTTLNPRRIPANRLVRVAAGADHLMIGLAEPAGNTTVELTGVADAGAAQFWDGAEWKPCRRRPAPGDALWLEVPPGHQAHVHDETEAAWLRLPGAVSGEVAARTAEAVIAAVHARRIGVEPLGVSDGTAGQRFRLRYRPAVVPGQSPTVETSTDDGWQAWRPVPSFTTSEAGEYAVRFDVAAGEIVFPPAVPGVDGSRRSTGPVPPAGTVVRIRDYWMGGGASGNVPAGALREIALPLPGVRVENPYPARGGSDAESEAELWSRAPGLLAAGGRAVTAADHEQLARQADPSLARVRCVADEQPGTVQLLLVATPPAARADRPGMADLLPSSASFEAVRSYLDERRLLAARLQVMPARYQGVEVEIDVVTVPGAEPHAARIEVEQALYAFLNPVVGGEDGTGWPFGEAIHESAIRKRVYRLPVVQDCVRIALSPVDPATGAHSPAQPVIPLVATALPLSIGHRVRIVRS